MGHGRAALLSLLWAACTPASAPSPAPAAPDPPALAASAPTPSPPLALASPPEPAPPAEAPAAPAPCAPLALDPLPRRAAPVDPPLVAIEDGDDTLAPFYEKVAALLRGERTTPLRVAVYGDSNITADWFTGGLRRTLQGRLGDAGHGFVALGKPWPGYVHMDVKHSAHLPGWAVHAVSTRPTSDHRYGVAGIEVQSTGPGARTRVETAGASAPVGRAASLIGVHFLSGPGLGSFSVKIDGETYPVTPTEAPDFSALAMHFAVPDGPHQLTIEARSTRPVRLFGATLERRHPGIVIDSLGVAASTTATIMRQDHTIHAQSLRLRGYDLVVLAHGAFDVVPWNTAESHASAVNAMIALHREALPGAALMMLSPVDYRGPRDDSRASPAHAAREKRALARAQRVAFWDQRAAMGGDGSIAQFKAHKMADPDQIHLNQKGGLFMGNRFALAIWGGLQTYLERHPTAGCPRATP